MEVLLESNTREALSAMLGISKWTARKWQETRFNCGVRLHHSSSKRNLVGMYRWISSFLLEVGSGLYDHRVRFFTSLV
jgi:hypothetical protein